MPPAAARSGTAASRGEASGPPAIIASEISFIARAKKKTIPMSLTAKWIQPCTTRSYDSCAVFAHTRAMTVPATSNRELSMMKDHRPPRFCCAIRRILPEPLHVDEIRVGSIQIRTDVDEDEDVPNRREPLRDDEVLQRLDAALRGDKRHNTPVHREPAGHIPTVGRGEDRARWTERRQEP